MEPDCFLACPQCMLRQAMRTCSEQASLSTKDPKLFWELSTNPWSLRIIWSSFSATAAVAAQLFRCATCVTLIGDAGRKYGFCSCGWSWRQHHRPMRWKTRETALAASARKETVARMSCPCFSQVRGPTPWKSQCRNEAIYARSTSPLHSDTFTWTIWSVSRTEGT